MLVILALLLSLATPPAHLRVQPWTGKQLPTTTVAGTKYLLLVRGRSGAKIRLVATKLATGWLAAFCTARVCSPQRVDVTLPSSGRTSFAFELIREQEDAPVRSGALITGDDGSQVTVPPAPR